MHSFCELEKPLEVWVCLASLERLSEVQELSFEKVRLAWASEIPFEKLLSRVQVEPSWEAWEEDPEVLEESGEFPSEEPSVRPRQEMAEHQLPFLLCLDETASEVLPEVELKQRKKAAFAPQLLVVTAPDTMEPMKVVAKWPSSKVK